MKLLVLAYEPIDAALLRSAVDDPDGVEVLVVTPAEQRSTLRFWMSDADDAIARADAVQEETVERLEEGGVAAAGDTGEHDPVIAVQDTLASFAADRVLVARRPGEEDVAERIRARVELPVDELEVTH